MRCRLSGHLFACYFLGSLSSLSSFVIGVWHHRSYAKGSLELHVDGVQLWGDFFSCCFNRHVVGSSISAVLDSTELLEIFPIYDIFLLVIGALQSAHSFTFGCYLGCHAVSDVLSFATLVKAGMVILWLDFWPVLGGSICGFGRRIIGFIVFDVAANICPCSEI